ARLDMYSTLVEDSIKGAANSAAEVWRTAGAHVEAVIEEYLASTGTTAPGFSCRWTFTGTGLPCASCARAGTG
ncbi:MAG: hypothetical protein LBT08_08955, partial [Synergistaceae bacterium]|nr:hypothetical protein [Synergistaceae bacterium]